jgi:sugar lactone lactonase YvrE
VAEEHLCVGVADPDTGGTRILKFDLDGGQVPCPWRLPVRARAFHACDENDRILVLANDGLYQANAEAGTADCVLRIADSEGMCVTDDSVWLTVHNEGTLIRWRRDGSHDVVARGLQFPRGVAVVGDTAYVAESVMGTYGYIRRIRPDDQATIAEGLSGPTMLQLSEDELSLLVLESTSGIVTRIGVDDGNIERKSVGLEGVVGLVQIRDKIYTLERMVPRRRFSSLSSNLGVSGTASGRLIRRSQDSSGTYILAEGLSNPLALCIPISFE